MSHERDDRPELSRDSEQFVQRLRESYAPEPPSAARAQAFDAALSERLDVPQREPWLKPALIAAAVAAAIGWLLMPSAELQPEQDPPQIAAQDSRAIEAPRVEDLQPEQAPPQIAAQDSRAIEAARVEELQPESAPPQIAAQDSRAIEAALVEIDHASDWEAELLSASEVEEFDASDDDEFLPDEYLAIAGAFFEG